MIITRPTLQTRPMIQRAFIRSWDYNNKSLRVTVFALRVLVVLWLLVLGGLLLSIGNAWGWILLPSAAAVMAISYWVYNTASKGWPVTKA